MVNKLGEYGLFLVPIGEIEGWLSHLGITGHGSDWLIKMFNFIGESESEPNYLNPGPDDVWHFLEQIAKWVNKPNRLGT